MQIANGKKMNWSDLGGQQLIQLLDYIVALNKEIATI